MTVHIQPAALRGLGVGYALVSGGKAEFAKFEKFSLVAEIGAMRIYALASDSPR